MSSDLEDQKESSNIYDAQPAQEVADKASSKSGNEDDGEKKAAGLPEEVERSRAKIAIIMFALGVCGDAPLSQSVMAIPF